MAGERVAPRVFRSYQRFTALTMTCEFDEHEMESRWIRHGGLRLYETL